MQYKHLVSKLNNRLQSNNHSLREAYIFQISNLQKSPGGAAWQS
jgi:hypothetical protein